MHIAMIAEAFALAAKVGVDLEVVLEIMSGSAASIWMLKDRRPRMLPAEPEVTSENVLHFTIGTVWLGQNARLWRLFREPVFAAGAAGFLISLSGLTLWPPLLSGIEVGDVSTGLMLFSLGVRLNTAPFAEWRVGLVGAVATPLTGMLLAFVFCLAFGLSSMETDVLLLFGALPPAVLNFMFAERYAQEPQKVASIVIMGNLGALVSISAALAIRFSG